MIHFNYKAHRFYRRFAAHLRQMLGRRLPRYLIVACSGGADSVALLDLMHRFATEHPVIPVVVHINHHLRGRESLRDERFVRVLCQKRNLPIVVIQAAISKSSGNIQTEARRQRYAALTAVARYLHSPVVLTAHHANDQAETVLLQVLRGSASLSGIREQRMLDRSIALLRPMLWMTRSQIDSYIQNARLRFVTDRSNRALKYTRNWIRHKVIPLLETHNPRVVEALCVLSQQSLRS